MTRNRVFHSFLISASVLLMSACATTRPPGYLDEKYFQAEAKYYEKFQFEGTTVYCAPVDRSSSQALFPGQCTRPRSVFRDRSQNVSGAGTIGRADDAVRDDSIGLDDAREF